MRSDLLLFLSFQKAQTETVRTYHVLVNNCSGRDDYSLANGTRNLAAKQTESNLWHIRFSTKYVVLSDLPRKIRLLHTRARVITKKKYNFIVSYLTFSLLWNYRCWSSVCKGRVDLQVDTRDSEDHIVPIFSPEYWGSMFFRIVHIHM